ncbi:MAG: hypothetical protein AVDCRST_MAG54-2611, partial [uncultured Actinomycetospora sp.]
AWRGHPRARDDLRHDVDAEPAHRRKLFGHLVRLQRELHLPRGRHHGRRRQRRVRHLRRDLVPRWRGRGRRGRRVPPLGVQVQRQARVHRPVGAGRRGQGRRRLPDLRGAV